MPTLSVVPVSWAGAPVVGPGVSVFHCNAGDEATLLTAARTFFSAINNVVPGGVQWSFPTSGDTIDELSGKRNGAWSAAGLTSVAAIGSGTWVNGVGARIKWPTIGVVNGRTVVGSTFIVPLVATAYEGSGNITSAVLTVLGPAAVTFGTTANGLRIYARPRPGHGGVSFPTLTGQAPDLVSWLRSRRT